MSNLPYNAVLWTAAQMQVARSGKAEGVLMNGWVSMSTDSHHVYMSSPLSVDDHLLALESKSAAHDHVDGVGDHAHTSRGDLPVRRPISGFKLLTKFPLGFWWILYDKTRSEV